MSHKGAGSAHKGAAPAHKVAAPAHKAAAPAHKVAAPAHKAAAPAHKVAAPAHKVAAPAHKAGPSKVVREERLVREVHIQVREVLERNQVREVREAPVKKHGEAKVLKAPAAKSPRKQVK